MCYMSIIGKGFVMFIEIEYKSTAKLTNSPTKQKFFLNNPFR